jgi:predicted MPP superfamily phosphohydrolase
MFHLTPALICLYLFLRTLFPLPWAQRYKIPAALLLILATQYHLLSRLLFGSMFSPELPREAAILVNTGFGAVLFMTAFQLLLDLGLLISAALRRRRVYAPPQARYAIIITAICLSAFGVSQAIVVPPLKQVEITLRDLPPEFDGYRMVQLTDLHISKLFQEPWVSEVVALTNAQKPDLIVISGDLIDGSPEDRKADIAPLKSLSAPDGVFIIPGNHEYYFGYERWMEQFAQLGMTGLPNAHAILQRGDARLVLAGIVDSTSLRMGLEGPDLPKALSGVSPDEAIILLDHKPRNAPDAAKAGVDLQLSGHTHGGMIKGFDAVVARFNGGFVSGLYPVDGMQLYVNNGTALWLGFAMRLGVPPELTVITLRAG